MRTLGNATDIATLLELTKRGEELLKCVPWFRGQSNNSWPLLPGAYRKHEILESQMAHHFRMRAPAIFPNCPAHSDYKAWLPLMQHYGLPTRLLDWTESLLVALFFAVHPENEDEPGNITLLSPGNLNQISIGSYIPFLADERIQPHIHSAFTPYSGKDLQTVAVLAPRVEQRMAVQQGCYTIHGNNDPLEKVKNSDEFLIRILIPENAKQNLRTELRICGISISALFPDLQHLAQEVSQLVYIE